MNNKLFGIVLIACTLLMACHKKEITKKATPIIAAEQNTKKEQQAPKLSGKKIAGNR